MTLNRTIREFTHVDIMCIKCNKKSTIPINITAFNKWRTGLLSLEDAFPMLTEEEKTFITIGYCSRCSATGS